MADPIGNALTFIVSEVIKQEQYNIIAVRRSVMITLNDGLTYLINGDILGMGSSVECPLCGHVLSENDIGSIISGNNTIRGIILCVNCRSIRVCEFDDTSKEAIRRSLKISEDFEKHVWEKLESSYIH